MTARLAIASGIVGLLATAFLVAFFGFEAPRVFAGAKIATPLGTTNDALLAVQFALLGVVAARLQPSTGWLVAAVGLAAALLVALPSALLVVRLIDFGLSVAPVTAGLLLAVAWIALTCLVAPATVGVAPARLGLALAAALVVGGMVFLALGGAGLRAAGDFLGNYPVLAAALVAGLCILVGVPAWTLWAGARGLGGAAG